MLSTRTWATLLLGTTTTAMSSTATVDHPLTSSHGAQDGVSAWGSFNVSSSPSSTSSSFTPTSAEAGDVHDAHLPVANAWTVALAVEYVVRLVLSVLMVLVNTLVLVTLGSTPSLRCAANLVIGSLAVTDLLVGLLGPAGLLIELELVVWPLMCRLGYAGVLAFGSVSINHLLFVSIDRYILISRPLHYNRFITKRRVWIFIMASWGWASTLSLSFFLGLSMQPAWKGRCRAELLYTLWFMVLLTLLHFFIPLIVMIYVYAAIFRLARRHQRAVRTSLKVSERLSGESLGGDGLRDGDSNGGGGGGEGSGGGGGGGSPNSCRAKLRAARLLVLPCGYFYLSWGPWFFVVLWAISTGSMVQPHALERFVQTLAILNSLGNPILYAVSQPLLGTAMMARLGALCKACCRRCLQSSQEYKVTSKPPAFEVTTLVAPPTCGVRTSV